MTRYLTLLLLLLLPLPAFSYVTPGLDLALGGAGGWSGGGSAGSEITRFRGRLSLIYEEGEDFSMEGGYEVASAWTAFPTVALGNVPTLRLWDIKRELTKDTQGQTVENLDRLYFKTRYGKFRLSAGRQAIGHGSGRFFNPSDIFAPLNPRASWSEYKGGVDGARLTARMGELSEVEGIFVAHGESWRESYKLARFRMTTGLGDISIYAGETLGVGTAALDLAFDLFGAGCYLDSSMRFDKKLADTAKVTLGGSYRVIEDLDVLLEAYYNGPGHEDPDEYRKTTKTREWANGEIFVTGKYYAMAGFTYALHPLVTVGANLLSNLGDTSFTLSPTLTWEATEYITVTTGFSTGFGGGSGAEFRDSPDFAFAEVRVNL